MTARTSDGGTPATPHSGTPPSPDDPAPGDEAAALEDELGPAPADRAQSARDRLGQARGRLRAVFSSDEKAPPFYPRLLRLRHVHPNGWQRALLVEGMLVLGVLVALADLATAWAPVILVVATAVVVKFHDLLTGLLPGRPDASEPAEPGDPPEH